MGLFMAGGVGSHAPVAGAPAFEGAERMGRGLSERLLAQLPHIAFTNRIQFAVMGLTTLLPPLHVRVTDGLRLRPWLAAELIGRDSGETFLQVFRLEHAIWVSTPCDFSGELALGIKEHLAVNGFRAVVTSFNGDYIGYVVPSRYYHLDAYETRLMSFYGPNLPAYLDELIRSLAAAAARL
jgi:hypothetical protein